MAVFNFLVFLCECIQALVVYCYMGVVGVGLMFGKCCFSILPIISLIVHCIPIEFSSSEHSVSNFIKITIIFMFAECVLSSVLPIFVLLLIFPDKVIFLIVYMVTISYFIVFYSEVVKDVLPEACCCCHSDDNESQSQSSDDSKVHRALGCCITFFL